ncbi:MAG: inositol monophosphatase family protein [Bacteroidales bacterium]
MESLQQLLEDAVIWAKEAGAIQLASFRTSDLGIETKSSVHDVVTRVDKECEAFLIKKIAEHYPSHGVLGEESGAHDLESDWVWVIDPLDGTGNYSQGLPIYCVSIGIRYKGETQVGVVYVPYLNELFTATKEGGAHLNGSPIHVGRKEDLNQSVLATGFPYDKDVNPDNNTNNVARLIPQIRGLRRMGAAAYDLCCVAAGFIDGFWEFNLQPWDVCAGILIIREAGGEVVAYRPDRNVSIVAGNRTIVSKILANLEVPSL